MLSIYINIFSPTDSCEEPSYIVARETAYRYVISLRSRRRQQTCKTNIIGGGSFEKSRGKLRISEKKKKGRKARPLKTQGKSRCVSEVFNQNEWCG